MIFELLKLNIAIADHEFDAIYPKHIKALTRKHWTPLSIAKLASEFLTEKSGAKVLDIGSGAGKFCLVGATHTKGHFTGIEQREDLVYLSRRLAFHHYIYNVKFIHTNITSIKLRNYDAFYFYNSFHENIDVLNKIDDNVKLDIKLYHLYSMYIVEQLATLPIGTRLVTYCSPLTIVPRNFELVDSLKGGLLKFWEKTDTRAHPAISQMEKKIRRNEKA